MKNMYVKFRPLRKLYRDTITNESDKKLFEKLRRIHFSETDELWRTLKFDSNIPEDSQCVVHKHQLENLIEKIRVQTSKLRDILHEDRTPLQKETLELLTQDIINIETILKFFDFENYQLLIEWSTY